MKKYVVTICIILFLILSSCIGYFAYSMANNNSGEDKLKAKINEEMNYLDSTIIALANTFNNISYANYKLMENQLPSPKQGGSSGNSGGSDSSGGSGSSKEGDQGQGADDKSGGGSNSITNMNLVPNSILVNKDEKINWDNLKEEVENMYSVWPSILIDLSVVNVNQGELLRFQDVLDDLTKTLEAKDKKQAVQKVADLYSLLPIYVKGYNQDKKEINLYNTKSNLLYAYAMIEQDGKAGEVQNYLKKAQSEFSYIMNNPTENMASINSVSKAYVILNELVKSNDISDKKIFYIHYKDLMQELEVL